MLHQRDHSNHTAADVKAASMDPKGIAWKVRDIAWKRDRLWGGTLLHGCVLLMFFVARGV